MIHTDYGMALAHIQPGLKHSKNGVQY